MSSTVLITGASGFLGSHIVDQCLAQGDRVRVFVRKKSDRSYLNTLPNLEIAYGDVSDASSLNSAPKGIDVVHHSAARVVDYGSRKQFYECNVQGTQNLLHAAKANGVRKFIFVSSPSVVMDMKDQIEIDESYPYPDRFVNLYSETKAVAEQFVLKANDETGSHPFITCALRPRAIWGPRDFHGFLPKVLSKIAQGKMRDISGGKKVSASLCYAVNAAYACTLAARSDQIGGKAYFITDRETIDVWEFASSVAALFGLPPITRKVNPKVAQILAKGFELAWKIPYLANQFSPPISRYSVGLTTLNSTFSTRSAEKDFGYVPLISHHQGLQLLKSWVDEIGGIEALIKIGNSN